MSKYFEIPMIVRIPADSLEIARINASRLLSDIDDRIYTGDYEYMTQVRIIDEVVDEKGKRSVAYDLVDYEDDEDIYERSL
jgi:hypothetical protein